MVRKLHRAEASCILTKQVRGLGKNWKVEVIWGEEEDKEQEEDEDEFKKGEEEEKRKKKGEQKVEAKEEEKENSTIPANF